MSLTLRRYLDEVRRGERDPKATVLSYLEKIKTQDTTNAFVRVHEDYVHDHLDEFVQRPLAGAPLGIKDIFMTKGYETTCCSKILQGYIPGYSSSAFEKLAQAGGCMLGKTNMDEFAMGASNETSCFGPVKNPFDETRTAGGSSGGSASAVASDLCLGAFATDTGGSIRLPASFCGIVGTKGTYGRTSRYGVQAMASSLDHIGVLTKTVEDAVILMSEISGQDPHDATTIPFTAQERQAWQDALAWQDVKGKRFAVPKQFFNEGIDPEVKEVCLRVIDALEKQGATISRIDVPIITYAVPTYYIITPAEVSTNMARFDGIRFGLQGNTREFDRMYEYYASIRDVGFGQEVKRRIITGAYVLSAGFYDAYYRKATAMRREMCREFCKLFASYDAILGPTSPEVARKIGDRMNDPVKMYLADIYTAIANLVGNPAISVPCGWVEKEGKKLPVGFHIMTAHRDEATMFGIGSVVEHIS